MPYAWNGICYQDTAYALEAFALSIPSSAGSTINAFTSAPTVSAAGLITWSISNRPLTTTAATTRTGTTQLLACTSPELDQWSIQSLFVPVAIFICVFLGFRTGFRP